MTAGVKIWDGADARDLLALEPVGADLFSTAVVQRNFGGTLYGGQLLGQALAAASATVAQQAAHSLHAYYLAAGGLDQPISYRVDRLRDGASSSVRRVTAVQNQRALFEMTCRFADAEEAAEVDSIPPPKGVPPPEACMDLVDYVAANAERLPPAVVANYGARRPLERRPIAPEEMFFRLADEPQRMFWLRLPSAVFVDGAADRRCLIAYLSDVWLAGVAFAQRTIVAVEPQTRLASLDHALWFHGEARPDEWLLYVTQSGGAHAGRGLGLGRLYDRGGRLIASSAQEGLMLRRRPERVQSAPPQP